MRSLLGAFREKHTVVRHNSDWVAVHVAPTSDECPAVTLLEFVELALVEDAGKHLVHVERCSVVDWDDSIKFVRVEKRVVRALAVQAVFQQARLNVEVLNDRTGNHQAMSFRKGEVVTDA